MILIISNKWDITVDFVIRELSLIGHPFLRINTEDFINEKTTITMPNFHIIISKQSKLYDLNNNVRVIWNRRPGKPFDDIPKNRRPSKATQKFISDQWFSFIESLQLVPGITWVNHPLANDAMENKIRQLFLAKNLGFNIPETLISNNLEDIRKKCMSFGGKIIAKALHSPLIEEPSKDYFIFTNKIDIKDLKNKEEFKICPSIYQQPLTPKIDYRVTVIGNKVLPVKIEAENNTSVELDWRTQKKDLKFSLCNLPGDIKKLCRSYVKESGLFFGAIDLVTYKKKFYFLEINPNGEWGWLQKPYNVPITKTLCEFMISKDK